MGSGPGALSDKKIVDCHNTNFKVGFNFEQSVELTFIKLDFDLTLLFFII